MRVDNILLGGRDNIDLLKILCEIFVILKGNGLKLKKKKYLFLQEESCYLGYKKNKCKFLDAILNAHIPTNASKLKTFLGVLNYYHKSLNRLSTILETLHKLL